MALSFMQETRRPPLGTLPGLLALTVASVRSGLPEEERGPTLHVLRKALGAAAASPCVLLAKANLDDNEGLF